MVLRFYPGGPQAIRGFTFWVTRKGTTGCNVAYSAGAKIPYDTYCGPDPKISQSRGMIYPNIGINDTALLPIEE